MLRPDSKTTEPCISTNAHRSSCTGSCAMPNQDKPEAKKPPPPQPSVVLRSIAVIVGCLALAYRLLIVSGSIRKEQRLDSTELALFLVTALLVFVLWRRDVLNRMKGLKICGSEVELLQKIDENTKANSKMLEDIR